jgi:prepilin-type N-terminal cleavage/methylation domain-containing protein
MKNTFKNTKGFTLIEVLASIVLVSIILMLVGTYFVNSYKQNHDLSRNFNSIQICQSLLEVYRAKEFADLEKSDGKKLTLDKPDIKNELQFDDTTEMPYLAEINIDRHPNLPNKILILTISVYSEDGKNRTSLEGYVRK